ncbi:MAG: winged helix-turn-helix domain-containing protein [Actinomycetota bacterium]
MRRFTIPQARRIALAAQGFADPRPAGRIDNRHLRRVIQRVGVVQLDSVNVVARAHYLPFFARLGAYPMELVDRMAWRSRELTEYWAHEAALVPVNRWPLFRHRMRAGWHHWPSMARWMEANPQVISEVMAEIRQRGALRPADLDHHANGEKGPWWSWSDAKGALEGLFFTGQVVVTERVRFERYYDLPERVLPAEVLYTEVDEDDARRRLLTFATQHLGIGTVPDIADYYRMKRQPASTILADLAREGVVDEVEVTGWKGPVYIDPSARRPRRIEAVALLCPFDPVVWFRPRAERLFNFHYRIEIYTPPSKRVYGYYVFPILLNEELVGRVDLKADRQAGMLRVRGSYIEPGHDPSRVAGPVAGELVLMSGWLGLNGVVVEERGDLAPALSRAL